ncbi:hypothetical protein LCGC14_2198150 [marine sediment metagenome]|uniref:Uncharacterized protein n=1 Tax=marine sediment metagenome TaxID=412755 RepID=A0A0F9E4N0_9ZZZZ
MKAVPLKKPVEGHIIDHLPLMFEVTQHTTFDHLSKQREDIVMHAPQIGGEFRAPGTGHLWFYKFTNPLRVVVIEIKQVEDACEILLDHTFPKTEPNFDWGAAARAML